MSKKTENEEHEEYMLTEISTARSGETIYNLKGCSAFEQRRFFNVIKKLAIYENLEKNGRLLKLPFAIGDILYSNISCQGDYERAKNKPYEHKVMFIEINGHNDYFTTVNVKTKRVFSFLFSDIGKIIFIDREDAKDKKLESEDTKQKLK